ncbi:Peptidoglycan/LPS O-acetylase OafA/YrhL, contains acyltransferase and SGNH-hydrolase domains [Actinopolyspora xinjiangensis]|uniref:Peptidoglycan/LPS O-acetylase OafA/YrhL, contains acyltransferase and SGNH-hydrolase domains n=1 Tax=Actinopolyspora xinjiangensis TaxID=405564 RepID=A0A1H0X0V7_9ACTN|nr:acyltransferase [Actinopolyspora xinjiangensis]SDP96086.1 Peptidoglycan/LPS O-acetylase OafA/YrhL, contains acyltransferase and SGNH-hydrolase domains [Actinopolyspora xinjiangensis]
MGERAPHVGHTRPGTRPARFAEPSHGFAWLRMIGALVVIYGHSYPLVSGNEMFPPEWPVQPDHGLLMGFFAMSGFQITGSWIGDPHPLRFAVKRVLRLWPPMLSVSLFVALVLGPLVTTLPLEDYFAARPTWGYVVNNAGMLTLRHYVPGVFEDNPWDGSVNGSLWTLPMELIAYAGLWVLLLLGAARRRERWLALLALVVLVVVDRRLAHAPGADTGGSLLSVPVEPLLSFSVAFAIGVVLRLYPVPRSPLAATSGLLALAAMPMSEVTSFWMCIAVSYAVIVFGHHWPARASVPGTWVNGSYGVYVWAFPIQQTLVLAGVGNQWLLLGLAAPIAYVVGTLSWKFVEEPTMRLRHYLVPHRARSSHRAGEPLGEPSGAPGHAPEQERGEEARETVFPGADSSGVDGPPTEPIHTSTVLPVESAEERTSPVLPRVPAGEGDGVDEDAGHRERGRW